MSKLKPYNNGLKIFVFKIKKLISQPIFIVLTIFGNLLIVGSATLLFKVEGGGLNPQIKSFLDTLWWAVSTVTTVGYGDVIPITSTGKIIGIVLMIVGIAIFWSYTALFAEALISKDILNLEDELKSIDKILKKIKKSELDENAELKEIISSMQKQLTHLEKTNHSSVNETNKS